MREQRTAARGLPFQHRAELFAVDPDQQKIAPAGEVFGGGLDRLRSRG